MKYFTKPNLRVKYLLILVFITFFFAPLLKAQNDWVEDQKMNFRINVPSNYQKNSLMDGTDKINVFISPDQNMVIRVRSIPLNQQITDVQLQSVFEQNIINGATRLSDELSDLNGIPARWSGYSWIYENVNTILANYYIIQQGMAYVVWAIVAENMAEQKTVEMANIMGSFELINGHPQNKNITPSQAFAGSTSTSLQSESSPPSQTNESKFSGSQSSGSKSQSGNQSSSSSNSSSYPELNVSAIYFGTDVNNNFEVINPTANIPSSAKKIHAVFKYDGNTNGQNFVVKWFSKTHNCLVIEDIYLPKLNGQHMVHASVENAGKPWPKGDYRAELWIDGYKISGRNFSIGMNTTPVTEKSVSPTNGTLLGKTYADGTGDNSTKSKGGKYLSVEIKNLDDNDEILVNITSGTLQFVHIHFRSSSGMWYDAYHGYDTKFKVKDILKGDRNSYTHLILNVNAQHERYLGTACQAEVWQIPSTINNSPAQQPLAQGLIEPAASGALGGKYVFESRSDGKSLVNFHYISIEADGLFIEKYQPKNSGNYIGGGQGKWKKNGNQLTFTYDDGIVEQYTVKSGNRIERQTDSGIVFIFKKEQ